MAAVLVVGLVGGGLEVGDVVVDEEDVAPGELFGVVPEGVLEGLGFGAGDFLDPAEHAEGVIVGDDDEAGGNDLGGAFAVQAVGPVFIAAAVVEVAAAEGVEEGRLAIGGPAAAGGAAVGGAAEDAKDAFVILGVDAAVHGDVGVDEALFFEVFGALFAGPAVVGEDGVLMGGKALVGVVEVKGVGQA